MKTFLKLIARLGGRFFKQSPLKNPVPQKPKPEDKPPVLKPDDSPSGYKIRWHH